MMQIFGLCLSQFEENLLFRSMSLGVKEAFLGWKRCDSILVLTERVTFKTVVQRGNRLQVPKKMRWLFKMESTQTLYVSIRPTCTFSQCESFYCKMTKDERIQIPKIVNQSAARRKTNLNRYAFEVTLRTIN